MTLLLTLSLQFYFFKSSGETYNINVKITDYIIILEKHTFLNTIWIEIWIELIFKLVKWCYKALENRGFTEGNAQSESRTRTSLRTTDFKVVCIDITTNTNEYQ